MAVCVVRRHAIAASFVAAFVALVFAVPSSGGRLRSPSPVTRAHDHHAGTPSPVVIDGSQLPSRLPESTGGTTLYVSPAGSDSGACTFASPCQSLDRAFDLAAPGTRIAMRGGVYRDQETLRDRWFPASNPVTVSNYAGEQPVLAGNAAADRYGYPALFVFDVRGVRVQGLTLSNSNGDGADVENSNDVELDRLSVHDNGQMGIYVGGLTYGSTQPYSKNVQIWDSWFTRNGGKFPGNEAYAAKGDHSIYYGGGPLDAAQHGAVDGVIANNVIYDQRTGRGIQLGESAQGTIVTNNTIYGATQSGFGTDAGDGIVVFNDGSDNFPSRDLVIVNNLITNTHSFAVYGSCSSSMSTNMVFNNLSFANGAGDYRSSYGDRCTLFTLGSNLAGADPLFRNATRQDFQLRDGSPAIGVADAAYAPPTDITGKPRGAAPDVGAFQH